LLGSLRWGERALMYPWVAAGLEWRVPSPPPVHNFEAPVTVDFEAYDYSPEARRDPL
jgi:cytochrome c oxidase subunit 1